MKKILVCLAIVILLFSLAGCHKKNITRMDDTYYIIDNHGILLLCQSGEDEAYLDAIQGLRGNQKELIQALEELHQLNMDSKVQNAIGIAYIRLRNFDDSEHILLDALDGAKTEDEYACILTNLGLVEAYKGNMDLRNQYYQNAVDTSVEDPIKRIAMESNLINIQMSEAESSASSNAKLKRLLKKEKKLLGSNQLIGIRNYKLLASGSAYDNHWERGIKFIEQAIQLNEALYQNQIIEADLYDTCSFIYNYYAPAQYKENALEYAILSVGTLAFW